ncbi:hypothetical protein P261_02368 [Lachnospiraceae bacterium TWA4]|nr:hypothetical protein P261_02368 [Lachnospiraceae bacterium TWA4]
MISKFKELCTGDITNPDVQKQIEDTFRGFQVQLVTGQLDVDVFSDEIEDVYNDYKERLANL